MSKDSCCDHIYTKIQLDIFLSIIISYFGLLLTMLVWYPNVSKAITAKESAQGELMTIWFMMLNSESQSSH